MNAVTEKYPQVKVVLHEKSSDILRKEAAEGKYDFAIVNLPIDESLLEYTPIESDELVLAVPTKMCDSLPKNEKIEFSACKDLPFIVVSQSQEMRRLFDKCCANADLEPKIAMEVVGISTAWSMCRAGIGATLLPRQFVKYMGLGDNINLYTLKHNIRSRQPVIVTKKGQYISEYAKYAIKLLTEQK
jgi:DNA-binding transcriptional LysR family regulator